MSRDFERECEYHFIQGRNMSATSSPSSSGNVKVIIGAQWGDEGKGKIVDLLADDIDYVCRGQVRASERLLLGPN